jgi:hypothetical protein
MDYLKEKKLFLKYLEIVTEKVEEINWFYIGSSIFILLLLIYIWDSVVGSQTSPWVIVGILAFFGILGMIVINLMPG